MSKLLNPVEYFELSQSAPTRLFYCFHVKPSLRECGAPSRVRLPCVDRPYYPDLGRD